MKTNNNAQHLFKDIYLSSYYSPFPREKSNNEVLTKSYAKRIGKNVAVIDIPPNVTSNYMKKNPLYFDIKKHKYRQTWKSRPKTAEKKIQTPRTSFTVYNANKLDNLMKCKNQKYSLSKTKLDTDCDKVNCFQIKAMKDRPKLTPTEVLNILNKMKFPTPPKKDPNYPVPKYINEFKIREMIEREYERLVEEEKDYPSGTFKIWEDDRVVILNNLNLIREQLINELSKFPVDYFWRATGIQNRRREIEKKLDEIDYALKLFGLTDVFIKY